MAYDILKRKNDGRDWSCGIGSDDESGFTFMYSTAKSQLDDLRSAVDLLNTDISQWYHGLSAKTADQERFIHGWQVWSKEFYQWYSDATRRWTRLTPELPWSIASKAETKSKELVVWRGEYEKVSGQKAVGPSPEIIAPPPRPKDDGGGGLWKWVAIAGGGALALALIQGQVSRFRAAV